MLAALEIKEPGTGSKSDVYLDGDRVVGIQRYTLTSGVAAVPRLTLELAVSAVNADVGNVLLYVPEETRETLIRFGWTPPEVGASDGR